MRSRLVRHLGAVFRATDTPDNRCPQCGYVHAVASPAPATGTSAQAIPTPGSLSICLKCGYLAQFDEAMKLRSFDADQLTPEQRAQVRRIQAAIQVRHKRGN